MSPCSTTSIWVCAGMSPASTPHPATEAAVQVAIDAGALLLLPADEGQAGSWEVGAMLVNEGRDRSWEMLRNRATEIV